VKNVLVKLLLIALTFAWFIGYFSKQEPWQVVSGFDKMPDQDKTSFYSPPDTRYPEIFWLGHAGNIIKWDGLNILLDPILSEYSVILPRLSKAPISAKDLPPIDFVLLSHMHYDHYDKDTLESLGVLKKLVVPNKSEKFISSVIKSKTEIIKLDENESYKEGDLEIISLKTLHNGSRNHPFSSEYRASAYLIKKGEISVYYSGDTGYGPQLKQVGLRYAPDIAILPIGAFEPDFLLYKYHLSPKDAVRAGLDLASKITIPTHFGTFRMALDRADIALPRFASEARRLGLKWELAKMYGD